MGTEGGKNDEKEWEFEGKMNGGGKEKMKGGGKGKMKGGGKGEDKGRREGEDKGRREGEDEGRREGEDEGRKGGGKGGREEEGEDDGRKRKTKKGHQERKCQWFLAHYQQTNQRIAVHRSRGTKYCTKSTLKLNQCSLSITFYILPQNRKYVRAFSAFFNFHYF